MNAVTVPGIGDATGLPGRNLFIAPGVSVHTAAVAAVATIRTNEGVEMKHQGSIRAMCRRFGTGAAAAATAGLVACGGGGGSSSGSGSLSVGVTDAPIDSAREVVVQFSSIKLKPAGGAPFTIEFESPQSIDLLQQRNGDSELLLQDEQVTAGAYDWIRLGVDLADVNDTYIRLDDGSVHELEIPSGAETGLKLVSGFTVADGGSLDLTIDFDLRKSVVMVSATEYKLKPALRLVQTDATGEIAVTAIGNYVDDRCADHEAQAVYVFEGDGVTPDDVDTGSDSNVDPVTTVSLELDDATGDFTGTAGFLDAGAYTAAFTCDPENDDPETDDGNDDVDGDVFFEDTVTLEVEAGETTPYELTL